MKAIREPLSQADVDRLNAAVLYGVADIAQHYVDAALRRRNRWWRRAVRALLSREKQP